MKQTWREVQISKCIRCGVKHKWLKVPMLAEIILIICAERIVRYLNGNKKRFVGAGLTVLVFLVSNSFSTPVFQSGMAETVTVLEEGGVEPVSLAQALPESTEEEIREELFYEEDEIGEHDAIDDQYSVDEILNSSVSHELMDQYTQGETEKTEFSKDDWNLILVNKQHPVPEGYTFELGTIAASMNVMPESFRSFLPC